MPPHLTSLPQLKAAPDVGLMPTTKATAVAPHRLNAGDVAQETQHAV